MYQNSNIYQRLRTCMVGQVWPPEFYNWIKDSAIRNTLKNISAETEEDLLELVNLLEKLNVQVIRPNINIPATLLEQQINNHKPLTPPPIVPGDYMILAGTKLVESFSFGPDANTYHMLYRDFFEHLNAQGNSIESIDNPAICAAMCYQIDNKVFYTKYDYQQHNEVQAIWQALFPNKQILRFHQHGHIDGWFCPVSPELLITAEDTERPKLMSLFYRTYFKESQIVVRGPTFKADRGFNTWQLKNTGNWWIPGEENNHKLSEFIDRYFKNWLGNIAETVFEVNAIIVDSQTLIVRKSDNAEVISAIEKQGVKVYQTPFRHSAFWDAGVNCVTLALDRHN